MDDDRYRFAVGDIVRVAGIVSPRMKVSKIDTIPGANGGVLIQCFWFNRRLEFQGHAFPPRHLAKASPWEDRPRGDVLVTPNGPVLLGAGDFEEHIDG